jgi:hypothetical protein
MSTRILIQVDSAKGGAALPPEAANLLQAAGATHIKASHAELPGLFTAVVPEGADPETLLRNLRKSPHIRHAEADQFRTIL